MNSTANEQVLTALQQVVGATLRNWLDENKFEVLQALLVDIPANQSPPATTKAAEEKDHPKFLNTATRGFGACDVEIPQVFESADFP